MAIVGIHVRFLGCRLVKYYSIWPESLTNRFQILSLQHSARLGVSTFLAPLLGIKNRNDMTRRTSCVLCFVCVCVFLALWWYFFSDKVFCSENKGSLVNVLWGLSSSILLNNSLLFLYDFSYLKRDPWDLYIYLSHRIHVWYIYLHVPYKLAKCR